MWCAMRNINFQGDTLALTPCRLNTYINLKLNHN
jgi:hypothetical protein